MPNVDGLPTELETLLPEVPDAAARLGDDPWLLFRSFPQKTDLLLSWFDSAVLKTATKKQAVEISTWFAHVVVCGPSFLFFSFKFF